HNGEALDTPFFGTGFVYEHDTAVEIALLAREPLIDLIRNNVSDAAEIVRRADILLTSELSAAEHVEQPELGPRAAVRLASDAPGHQRLGMDGLPIRIARRNVRVGDPLDECGRIDRSEQAAALEIRCDDLRNAARRFPVIRAAGKEVRQRDR